MQPETASTKQNRWRRMFWNLKRRGSTAVALFAQNVFQLFKSEKEGNVLWSWNAGAPAKKCTARIRTAIWPVNGKKVNEVRVKNKEGRKNKQGRLLWTSAHMYIASKADTERTLRQIYLSSLCFDFVCGVNAWPSNQQHCKPDKQHNKKVIRRSRRLSNSTIRKSRTVVPAPALPSLG